MDFSRLKMFQVVARHGSLTAAARELQLTPSAISHGIRTLERELGCRLLDRVAKKVHLNHRGEQFLAHIEKPLKALGEASHAVRRLEEWGLTRLRVGAPVTICQYLLPMVLRDLKRKYPKTSIQISGVDSPDLSEAILKNHLDLGVGLSPDKMGALDARSLFRDELMFAMSPHHRWAGLRIIPRDQIAEENFILYQHHSLSSRLVEHHFQNEDVHPQSIMEIPSVEAIKEMVKAGLGIGVLAPWTAQKDLQRRRMILRPFGTRPITRDWVVLHQRNRRLNLVEHHFWQLLRRYASTLPTDRRDLPRHSRMG